MIHGVLRGKIHPQSCVGGGGSYEFDGGAFGDCARPLQIEIRFGLVAGDDAGVRAIQDDDGIVRRQTKETAKVFNVLHVYVALANDRDGLTGAVNYGSWAAIPERQDVIDGRKIVGAQAVTRDRL